MLQTRRIVLIFGKICSGKSTYADALSYVTKAKRITVSDIVKRVSGKVSRSELQNTQNLDMQIAEELIAEIQKYDKVVVDGIRQSSIVWGLINEFGFDNINMLWLDVSDEVRKYRFYDRSIAKDDLSFEEADLRDEHLGLLDVAKVFKSWYIKVNN
jgi:adenylate kinase family enzyme